MKILIFGGTGMLGHKLYQRLREKADVRATIRGEVADVAPFGIFDERSVIGSVDVSDPASIRRAIDEASPDVVINAVGVIKQRPGAEDVIDNLTVNAIFPHRLAQLSADSGFRLITISTDCVFSGSKGNYSEDDEPDAKDIYGRSKQLGEVVRPNCLTLRTSLIGPEIGQKRSLFEWFIAQEGRRINGYTKAIFSGFPTIVFADIIEDLIFRSPDLNGLYNVSSPPISKYDLLTLIGKKAGMNIRIDPVDLPAIDRSLDSSRFQKATGFRQPAWPEMIDKMLSDRTS